MNVKKGHTTSGSPQTFHWEKAKDLHYLRLHFKTIRVQCLLLEFVYPERYPAKSLFAPFREFYRQTSRLRDLTVAREQWGKIIQRYHLPSAGFQNYLSQHYGEEKRHIEQIPLPDIEGFEQGHQQEIPSKDLRKAISQLMQQLMEKMEASRQNPETALNLHWQRKQIKKLIYLNRIVKETTPLWDEALTTTLEILDKKLGIWHDFQMLLQLTEEYARSHSGATTQHWLPRVTRTVVAEQIQVMESFKELIR